MCNDIIDPQIRACIIASYVGSNGGKIVSIPTMQQYLLKQTGILEKDYNIRNTMVKLTNLKGFFFVDREGLRHEGETQRALREANERKAERAKLEAAVAAAKAEVDAATAKLNKLEADLTVQRKQHLAAQYGAHV